MKFSSKILLNTVACKSKNSKKSFQYSKIEIQIIKISNNVFRFQRLTSFNKNYITDLSYSYSVEFLDYLMYFFIAIQKVNYRLDIYKNTLLSTDEYLTTIIPKPLIQKSYIQNYNETFYQLCLPLENWHDQDLNTSVYITHARNLRLGVKEKCVYRYIKHNCGA